MKIVKYEFSIGREIIEGSVEVEDDAMRKDIELTILSDATCGELGCNWYIEQEK